MPGIVIIGAGHAGIQLATSLREEGFEGTIDLVSAEADHPYHRPPLSKTFMSAPDMPLQPLQAAHLLEQKGIALHSDETATRIDRPGKRVELQSGPALAYDRLVDGQEVCTTGI